MKKMNKFLSISLATLMLCSSFSMSTYAQSEGKNTDEFKYENSIGSESSDFITNDEPIGKDNTQGVESAYKNVIMDENSISINGLPEKTDVYLTVTPSYTTQIPKVIILDNTGSAKYDIGVKGDLAGTQKITIRPVDKVEDTDSVDFYMEEQDLSFDPKGDVLATIDQTKTTWTWSEVDVDKYSWLPSAGEISAPDISAGCWKGTFNFAISVDNLNPSSDKYFALYSSNSQVVLAETEAETPMTWRKIFYNNFGEIEEDLTDIVYDKGYYGISYYASVITFFLNLNADDPFIKAAQISDEAADEYFNTYLLPYIKQQLGDTTSKNADDVLKKYYGYTAHELAEKAIIYTTDIILESAIEKQYQYDISLYAALLLDIINFQMAHYSDAAAADIMRPMNRDEIDEFFNTEILPKLKIASGAEDADHIQNANDIVINAYDFSFDDILLYYENGTIPVTGNVLGAQGPQRYQGNNSSTAFTFTVKEAKNITFYIQTQANAIVGLDFDSNPTKNELKWFKEITPELYYQTIMAHPTWSTYRVIAYAVFTTYEPPVTDSSIINGLITAANQSDTAFNEYFNVNILPYYMIEINSIDELCEYYLGYTIQECIDFVDKAIWPSSLNIDYYQYGFGASGENYITKSFTRYFEPGIYTLYVSSVKTDSDNGSVIIEFPSGLEEIQTKTYFKNDNQSGLIEGSTQVIINPDYSYYTIDSYVKYLETNDASVLVKNTNRKQLPSDLIIPNKLFGYTNNGIPNRLLYGYEELEYVYVPTSCKTIGIEAFANNSIQEIVFRGGNISDENVFGSNDNNIELITLSNDQNYLPLFTGWTNLKGVLNINENITIIPGNTFRDCINLSFVELPDTMKIISAYAFYNCENLSISLPSSVEVVDEYTFYNCSKLKDLYLPNLTEYIGEYAFYNCTGLKKVYIGPSGTSYENINGEAVITATHVAAFAGCINVEEITIPCDFFVKNDNLPEKYCFGAKLNKVTFIPGTNSTRLYTGAFMHKDAIVDIIIEEGVTEICTGSFLCESVSSHDNFTINSIIIPESMQIIAYQAFKNANISSITFLGEDINMMDGSAFEGCGVFTVYGKENSYFQTWANRNNHTFIVI